MSKQQLNKQSERSGPGNIVLALLIFLPIVLYNAVATGKTVYSFADFNSEQALAYSQSALERVVDNHQLIGRNGEIVQLADFRGKPLIVSFIYTSCYHICPVITKNLSHAANIAEEALGDEAFNVITIGFDSANDSPQRMKYFADQRGIEKDNWYFLSASTEVIDKVSENFGFIFYPSSKGFDHMAQTSIVDANGKIYRQVYGTSIDVIQLVEPLKELIFGQPGTSTLNLAQWINNIKLFCTIYDPSTGRYKFDYSIFLAFIIGFLCLASVVVFVVHSWKAHPGRTSH